MRSRQYKALKTDFPPLAETLCLAADGLDLQTIQKTASRLKRFLGQQIRDEESRVFPFLSRHIPKLERLIHILLIEHKRLMRLLAGIEKMARSKKPSIRLLRAQIQDFAVLLKTHQWMERRLLVSVAMKLLHEDEKKAIGLLA